MAHVYAMVRTSYHFVGRFDSAGVRNHDAWKDADDDSGHEWVSLPHMGALRFMELARQLSLVTAVFAIGALLAGTADTSYAGAPTLSDTVVVSNFGVLFAGSFETFAAGSKMSSRPQFLVIGCKKEKPGVPTPCVDNTFLSLGNGAGDVAQSSLTGDIAVTVPLGVPGLCPAGCVGVWAPGENGNSAPIQFLGGPAGSTVVSPLPFPVLNNETGLSLDQGVAYNNPFRVESDATKSVTSGLQAPAITVTDQFAVTNFGLAVIASTEFPTELCETTPTIGTITEFNSGDTGNVAPTPNVPVVVLTLPALAGPFISNATIGGCDTALDGPIGAAFDGLGDLWVVNEGLAGIGQGPPGFVVEYAPGAFGDASQSTSSVCWT